MILCLISNSERLNDTIDDMVHISHTEDILYNMYQFTEPIQSVIVTKRYIDNIGYKKTADAIMALNYIKPVKVIYISYEKGLDIFVKELVDLNLVTLNANLEDMTKEVYLKLLQHEMEFSLENISDNISMEINEIIAKYKITDIESRENFVTLNKDAIIKGLESLNMLVEENRNLININKKHEAEIETLKTSEKNKIKKLNRLLKDNEDLLMLNNKWYRNYNSCFDSIERFNEQFDKDFILSNQNEDIKIIYFKELDDINFVRLFNEIYERLNLIKYTKALIIDNNQFRDYSSLDFSTIPKEIELKNLVRLRKMVRYANPKPVLQKLCSKPFKTEALLILDRTQNTTTYLDNVNTFYLGNYRNNFKDIEINDNAFISPYEGLWTIIKDLLIPIGNNEINPKAYSRICRANTFTNYIESLT